MSGTEARPVQVVTDSAADIPPDLLAGRPITVVPLTVEVAGRTYRDGIDLTRSEFLDFLRQGETPRTSQPSVGAFQEVYASLVEGGYDVIAVHIAAKLSGTFNASRAAVDATAPGRVRLIDSGSVTMGTGWLAIEAADLAARGWGRDQIADRIERRVADVRLYAILDTLEYLQRGGRIGRTSALLGSALQIKPVVEVRDGAVEPLERVRTWRRAVDRLVALAEAQMPFDRLAVLHIAAPDAAREVTSRLQALQPELDLALAEIGTVIATYAGPGAIGITGLVRAAGEDA